MSCGRGWSRCWPIPRVVFATRAGSATARVPVWRGSCTCSTPTRPGWRCPTVSWGCPAGRRVGGVWRSGSGGGCSLGRLGLLQARAGRGGPTRLVAGDRGCLAGGGEKGGEKVARTLLGRPGSRYHLAVRRPRRRRSRCSLSAGNENERRQLLPLVDCLLGARDPARAAVGRPRLCLGRARAGAARARDRALYLPAAPSRPAHP